MKLTKKQRQAIFEALGEASMYWIPPPSHQVFDSLTCEEIGERLVAFLEKIDDYPDADPDQEFKGFW